MADHNLAGDIRVDDGHGEVGPEGGDERQLVVPGRRMNNEWVVAFRKMIGGRPTGATTDIDAWTYVFHPRGAGRSQSIAVGFRQGGEGEWVACYQIDLSALPDFLPFGVVDPTRVGGGQCNQPGCDFVCTSRQSGLEHYRNRHMGAMCLFHEEGTRLCGRVLANGDVCGHLNQHLEPRRVGNQYQCAWPGNVQIVTPSGDTIPAQRQCQKLYSTKSSACRHARSHHCQLMVALYKTPS